MNQSVTLRLILNATNTKALGAITADEERSATIDVQMATIPASSRPTPQVVR